MNYDAWLEEPYQAQQEDLERFDRYCDELCDTDPTAIALCEASELLRKQRMPSLLTRLDDLISEYLMTVYNRHIDDIQEDAAVTAYEERQANRACEDGRYDP